MKWKRLAALLLLLSLLSGCWNRRELETLNIVLAGAVDWDPEAGEYELTVQVAIPAGLKTGQGGGGGAGPPYNVIVGRGATVFQAIRNASRFASRRLWWGHVQVLLFGEEAARRDVTDLVNFFSRDGESRLLYWTFLTRGKAGDLLKQQVTAEQIPAMGLLQLIRNAGSTSFAPQFRLAELFLTLQSPGAALVGVIALDSQAMRPKGQPGLAFRLGGSGVIEKARLIGYLDEAETRGALWARSEVKSGVLLIACPGATDETVSMEIIHASGRIEPYLDKQGRLQAEIRIRTEVNVADQECETPPSRAEVAEELNQRTASAVRSEVERALKAVP